MGTRAIGGRYSQFESIKSSNRQFVGVPKLVERFARTNDVSA